jgi:ribonuclease P protein component
MLARQYRLHKNFQYTYVYKRGTTVPARNLTLVYVKASGGVRVGFSVSNKVGKAVVRNKVKRRLRASVKRIMPQMKRGYNYVFSARPGIAADLYPDIHNTVVYLLKKAGLYEFSQVK